MTWCKAEPEGLVFLGRADEQIKLGGRRIELGEVDAALQALPGVAGAAAAVRTARSGNQLLVGYVVTQDGWDQAAAVEQLRAELPAALVPLLAPVDDLPTRTSGKVDRNALPWPLRGPGDRRRRRSSCTAPRPGSPSSGARSSASRSRGAARRLLRDRRQQPGRRPAHHAAAHPLPERRRARHLPAARRCASWPGIWRSPRRTTAPPGSSRRCPLRAKVVQLLAAAPAVHAARAALDGGAGRARATCCTGSAVSVGADRLVVAGRRRRAAALQPARAARDRGGRCAAAAARGASPARYPRGGSVHLRLWTAERLAEFSGATSLTGVLAGAVRAGAGRQGRRRTSTCTRCRR